MTPASLVFPLLNRLRRSRSATDGQVLVIFALSIFVVVGAVALSIDGGFILAERRQVQTAADAASLAAAKAVFDLKPSLATSSGQSYGIFNAGADSTVTINWPPTSGAYAGDALYLEAVVTKPVRKFFVGAIYPGSWTVTARATAGIELVQRPYALLALKDCASGGQGIYINGSGTVNVHEGSIMSNCNIDRSGQSNVVTSGGAIDAAGTINPGTLWSAAEGFNKRPKIADPIVQAGIVPPSKTAAQAVRSVTTVAQLNAAVTNLDSQQRCPGSTICVMQPGYYGGSLTLTAQAGTIQMQPGIYYFDESFTLAGMTNQSRFTGSNVLIYVTGNARITPENAAINLSASPTSLYDGGLNGMLLWIANCTEFRMKANGTFTLTGVIYAPCSYVELYGSPGSNGMQVVVGDLRLSGGGSFNVLYTEYVKMDTPRVFLVE